MPYEHGIATAIHAPEQQWQRRVPTVDCGSQPMRRTAQAEALQARIKKEEEFREEQRKRAEDNAIKRKEKAERKKAEKAQKMAAEAEEAEQIQQVRHMRLTGLRRAWETKTGLDHLGALRPKGLSLFCVGAMVGEEPGGVVPNEEGADERGRRATASRGAHGPDSRRPMRGADL